MDDKTKSSILDFPRKTLPKKLWKHPEGRLPRLKDDLRDLIINTAKEHLEKFNLPLKAVTLYGGAATYQWSEGADVDTSVYVDWSNFSGDPLDVQKYFKEIEMPYEGHPVHLFVKPPEQVEVYEVSEAYYDVLNDEWLLPPLILPADFDPDEFFAPFIKEAEAKAQKIDVMIGDLIREWSILSKAVDALPQARDPEEVRDRISIQKTAVKSIVDNLVETYLTVRERRYDMHNEIRDRYERGEKVGRFARFQEPEIIWKYLDRSGYNDFISQLHQFRKKGILDKYFESI